MPATATHAFFAEDIFNKLDNNLKNKINCEKKAFLMFAQSTDPLMFYNIMNLKKGKDIRKFQYIFHTTKTNEFFTNLITFIKENKYYNEPKILVFLYGFICHYSLDSNIHPYVFYKTGNFNKRDKTSIKYNCLHNYIETFFDNILISKRKNINYAKFDICKYCFDLSDFSSQLKETINYSFNQTFKIKKMSQIYFTSLKQMNLFLKLFRKDSYGIKKLGYKFIDKVTPSNSFIFDSLSYKQSIEDNNNYLNLDHKLWNYPIDKNITGTKSFFDLYNNSLKETLSIIKQINQYFINDVPIDIDKIFKNKSYITGVDCNNKQKQEYFEF